MLTRVCRGCLVLFGWWSDGCEARIGALLEKPLRSVDLPSAARLMSKRPGRRVAQVLAGLSRFAHLINVDFFSDLLQARADGALCGVHRDVLNPCLATVNIRKRVRTENTKTSKDSVVETIETIAPTSIYFITNLLGAFSRLQGKRYLFYFQEGRTDGRRFICT